MDWRCFFAFFCILLLATKMDLHFVCIFLASWFLGGPFFSCICFAFFLHLYRLSCSPERGTARPHNHRGLLGFNKTMSAAAFAFWGDFCRAKAPQGPRAVNCGVPDDLGSRHRKPSTKLFLGNHATVDDKVLHVLIYKNCRTCAIVAYVRSCRMYIINSIIIILQDSNLTPALMQTRLMSARSWKPYLSVSSSLSSSTSKFAYIYIYLGCLYVYIYVYMHVYWYGSVYVTTYMFIYLYVCRHIYSSIHQSIYVPMYLSILPSIYQSIYLSTFLSIYLPIYVAIYLFACMYVCMYVCKQRNVFVAHTCIFLCIYMQI